MVTFLPFAISNIIFIVPFEITSSKNLMIITGLSHTFLMLTYIALFGLFGYMQNRVWQKFTKLNFFDGRINSNQLLAFYVLTQIYLAVHIWIMFMFSKGFVAYILTGGSSDATSLYTQFFHSSMSLDEMSTMNSTFSVVMLLIHWNPFNIILKFMIIKFESIT